jgi:hypothetical protein
VISFTPRLLYPQGKSPWYSLYRRLGEPQSLSGCGGEEKNSHPLSGLEPPIIQPVAQRCTTELTRLLKGSNDVEVRVINVATSRNLSRGPCTHVATFVKVKVVSLLN